MKPKKRSLWISIGVIVLVALALIIILSSNNSKEDTIKIGILTPLTGDAAVWGLEIQKGVELAYDSVKDEKIDGKNIEIFF